MNKKLICTLISSCVMTQFLVACNSGTSTTASEGKSPQKASLTKNLKNGTDNIQGLWGAVTASDSAGKEGKTNFLINNNTDAKFVRLGCVSSGGDMPLTASGRDAIDPYSTLQMKENTNSHAAHYAQSHNGFIQSPLNEQESVLLTIAGDGKGHNATSTASDLTCYYKLDNGSDEPMYVKLVGHNEGYAVVSAGMQEIDKPYNDVQKAVKANSQTAEWVKNGGTLSAIAATKIGFRVWSNSQVNSYIDNFVNSISGQRGLDAPIAQDFKDLLKELKEGSLRRDLNRIFMDGTISRADKLSEGERIYKEILDHHPDLFLNEAEKSKSVHAFHEALTKDMEAVPGEGKVIELNFDLRDITQMKVSLSNNSVGSKMVTSDFKLDSYHLAGALDETDKKFLNKQIKKLINGDTKNFAKLKEPGTWKEFAKAASETDDGAELVLYFNQVAQMLKEGKSFGSIASKSTMAGISEAVPIAADGEKLERLLEASQEAKGIAFASKIFSVAEIAEFGIGVFGVQALMDLATLPPSVGSYDTSIASFKWEEVTQADAQRWNSAHLTPENEIKANTSIGIGVSGYNLSTNQNLTLSYNDSAIDTDRQKIYSIDNTYVDTPFLRASDDYGNDPWFGNVNKGQSANGNALIQTDIREVTGAPDFVQQAQREALKSSGFGSTVVPVISAPILANQPSLSAITPGVGGQMTNGGLLSAKPVKLLTAKVKTKLGDVEGYVLPENSKLTLPMKIVNKTGFKDMLYSRALTSSYLPNDEDSHIQLSKSMKGYNNLLGLMPTVYSAFTCKAPYAYGNTCNYEVALTRGTTSSTKSVGKVYVADAYGDSLPLTVFVGYNLILDQQSIETDGSDLVTFVAKVATPDGYTGLSLANLPKGAKVVRGCDSALSQGDSCTFKLDFSNVEQGEYKLQVRGKSTDGDLKDNDIENITVTVTYPW